MKFNEILILRSEEALLDEEKAERYVELLSNIQDLDLEKDPKELSKDLLKLCYESDTVRPEYIDVNLKNIIDIENLSDEDAQKIESLSKTFNQEVMKYQAREQNLISTIVEYDVAKEAMDLDIISDNHESMILNPTKYKESEDLQISQIEGSAIGNFVPDKENFELSVILPNEAARLKAKKEAETAPELDETLEQETQELESPEQEQDKEENKLENEESEKLKEVDEIEGNFFTNWLNERKRKNAEAKAEKQKIEDMSKYNPFLSYNKKDHKKFQAYYFDQLQKERGFELNKKPYAFYSSRKALYDDNNKVMMTMKFDRVSGNANTAFMPKATADNLYIAFESLPPKHHKIQLLEPTDDNLEALRDCLQKRIDNGLPIDHIKCARRVDKRVKNLLKEMQNQHELVIGQDLKLMDEEPEDPKEEQKLENNQDSPENTQDSPKNEDELENTQDSPKNKDELENTQDEPKNDNSVQNKAENDPSLQKAAAVAATAAVVNQSNDDQELQEQSSQVENSQKEQNFNEQYQQEQNFDEQYQQEQDFNEQYQPEQSFHDDPNFPYFEADYGMPPQFDSVDDDMGMHHNFDMSELDHFANHGFSQEQNFDNEPQQMMETDSPIPSRNDELESLENEVNGKIENKDVDESLKNDLGYKELEAALNNENNPTSDEVSNSNKNDKKRQSRRP
jgi:hypothetical protein